MHPSYYLFPQGFDRGPFGAKFSTPLWMPFSVAALATIFCWRLDRHRSQLGLCVKCGYNLTGNKSGVCPECGTTCRA